MNLKSKQKRNFSIKINDTENCVIDYQVHTYFAYEDMSLLMLC